MTRARPDHARSDRATGTGRHAAVPPAVPPAVPSPVPRPPAAPSPARTVRLPWPDRLLRGFSGVLAGGLVALALGLAVVWLGSGRFGVPGPGGGTVVAHLAGAVAAVAGQRVADRRPDRTGTAAAGIVVLVTVAVLGFVWFL